MDYTVQQGQTLTDIAIQIYGSTEMLFQLCNDNNLSVDSDINVGDVLTYDDELGDRIVANAILANDLTISNLGDSDYKESGSDDESGEDEKGNFLLADGSIFYTSDSEIFNVTE